MIQNIWVLRNDDTIAIKSYTNQLKKSNVNT